MLKDIPSTGKEKERIYWNFSTLSSNQNRNKELH